MKLPKEDNKDVPYIRFSLPRAVHEILQRTEKVGIFLQLDKHSSRHIGRMRIIGQNRRGRLRRGGKTFKKNVSQYFSRRFSHSIRKYGKTWTPFFLS